jgi:hypothetical protein
LRDIRCTTYHDDLRLNADSAQGGDNRWAGHIRSSASLRAKRES